MSGSSCSDLADRLLPAFKSPAGLPHTQINRRSGKASTVGHVALGEVGAVQLELYYLSHVTGKRRYKAAADKILDTILASTWHQSRIHKGLFPITMAIETGQFTSNKISLGPQAGEFYETLLKMWLLTGKTDKKIRELYAHAIEEMMAINQQVLTSPFLTR